MELNQQTYLQFEPVYAKIQIRNYSGHPLIFGSNKEFQGGIKFHIYGPSGLIIEPKGTEMPSLIGILLEPGQTKEIVIPISRYYPLGVLGRYTVKAVVSHPQLANSFQSNTGSLTVSRGLMIWEHLFGVPQLIPDASKVNEAIPERQYRIYSLYDRNKNYFYLVVEDKDTIYALHRIGVEMSRNIPTCEVDRLSRLHILISTNPHISSYFIFDTDGKLEKRTVYRKTTSKPELVRNPENGDISIAGGEEARKDVDYQDDVGTTPTTLEDPAMKTDEEKLAAAAARKAAAEDKRISAEKERERDK